MGDKRWTYQEEIKIIFTCCFLNAPQGLTVRPESGSEAKMSARNDGGMEAQTAPLGGRGDTTDSPCRKLITETISKSFYCGCNWGMEKINSLFPFLNVKEEEKTEPTAAYWRKKISAGKHYWLSLINRIFITATQPLCTRCGTSGHILCCENSWKRTLCEALLAAKLF